MDDKVDQIGQDKPEYTYTDIQKESLGDIVSNTEVKEPVVETPKEEPTTPEPKVEPVVDIEEVAKRVADETAKRVVEESNKPEPPPIKTGAEEFMDNAKKEGKDPTWDEAFKFIEERATARAIEAIEAKNKAEVERVQQEQKAREDAQADETKRINTIIDDELDDLYNAGKLTKIKDANNPSDQGVMERKELFRVWTEVNETRRKEGKPEIISPTRIYELHGYKKPTAQPPGADLPISGNKGSATPPSSEQSYSYQDLKKPWGFFSRNGK